AHLAGPPEVPGRKGTPRAFRPRRGVRELVSKSQPPRPEEAVLSSIVPLAAPATSPGLPDAGLAIRPRCRSRVVPSAGPAAEGTRQLGWREIAGPAGRQWFR